MAGKSVKKNTAEKSARKKGRGNLIIVSNRLPYTRGGANGEDFLWQKSTGGLITAMEPILLSRRGTWVGWDGMVDRSPDKARPRILDVKSIRTSEKKPRTEGSYGILCVPVSEKEVKEYYDDFSTGTLWGLFHYFFEKFDLLGVAEIASGGYNVNCQFVFFGFVSGDDLHKLH